MRLVEVTTVVGQPSEVGVRIEHELPLGFMETNRAGVVLWGCAQNSLKASLQLPHGKGAVVGQLRDPILALALIKELGGGPNELQIVFANQLLVDQKVFQGFDGFLV